MAAFLICSLLISNEFNLGLYIGETLFTSNIAFVYGDTALDGKSRREDIDTKVEASHYGLAFGMKFHRQLFAVLFSLSWLCSLPIV